MSFHSESDMMSKELQNSDLIYVNLMTNVFKIILKYCGKIIAKYCHLLPSGNQTEEIAFDLISLFHVQIQEPTRSSTTTRAFVFPAKFHYHKIFETRSR